MNRCWVKFVPVMGAFAAGLMAAGLVSGQPGDKETHNQSEPGVQHEAFGKLAGEYVTASKLIVSDGADPFESVGTARVSSIVDGRFVAIDESGEILDNPFKSQKIWGFNVSTGKYESVWMYTGSTAMTTLRGKSDDGGKTIRLEGSFEDMDTKSKYSAEFAVLAENSFRVVQTALNIDGSAGPRIETLYTRK